MKKMKRDLKEEYWEDEINLDPELFCACRGESAHSQTRKHWGQEWDEIFSILSIARMNQGESRFMLNAHLGFLSYHLR